MKTTFSGVAAFALAAALGGTALAQTPAAAPQGARPAEPVSRADFVQRRVERLRAADANGDGQVTAEEMRAHAQRPAAAPDQAQDQGQGQRRPRAAGRAPIVIAEVERKADEAFTRMDANGDGLLSREEGRAALQAGGAERGQKHERPRMERRSSAPAASPSTPVSE